MECAERRHEPDRAAPRAAGIRADAGSGDCTVSGTTSHPSWFERLCSIATATGYRPGKRTHQVGVRSLLRAIHEFVVRYCRLRRHGGESFGTVAKFDSLVV